MQTGQTDGWNPPWARRLHWPAFAVFCGSVALDLWATSTNWAKPTLAAAFHGLPWLLGAFTLGVGLARSHPAQNIILAAAGSMILSSTFGLLYHLSSEISIPAARPLIREALIWLTFAVASIGVSRQCIRKFHYWRHFGYSAFALAFFLLVSVKARSNFVEGTKAPDAANIGLEREHGVVGNKWVETPAIAVEALAQLALMIPILRSKRPSRMPKEWHSLTVLMVAILWLEAGQWVGLERRTGRMERPNLPITVTPIRPLPTLVESLFKKHQRNSLHGTVCGVVCGCRK